MMEALLPQSSCAKVMNALGADLVSDWSRRMTGNVVFIDGGSHIMG